MRAAFAGDADPRRGAFRALLGDRRMSVFADPESSFRVEGLFELDLEMPDVRHSDESGRLTKLVAGGRSATADDIPEDELRELVVTLAAYSWVRVLHVRARAVLPSDSGPDGPDGPDGRGDARCGL